MLVWCGAAVVVVVVVVVVAPAVTILPNDAARSKVMC